MLTKRGREVSKLLAIREREGLTYAELAERTGLSPTTLSWWACRLRRECAIESQLLDVEIADAEPDDEFSGVSVQVAGVLVEVGREFDSDTLRRVVDVLLDRC